MKKLVALLLVLVMAVSMFSLVACGNDTPDQPDQPNKRIHIANYYTEAHITKNQSQDNNKTRTKQ